MNKIYQDNGWGEVCAQIHNRIIVNRNDPRRNDPDIGPIIARINSDDEQRLRTAQEFEAQNICKLLGLTIH